MNLTVVETPISKLRNILSPIYGLNDLVNAYKNREDVKDLMFECSEKCEEQKESVHSILKEIEQQSNADKASIDKLELQLKNITEELRISNLLREPENRLYWSEHSDLDFFNGHRPAKDNRILSEIAKHIGL